MSKQFSNVPLIRHSRSRFDLSHGVKSSGNVGTLYPFEWQEVYAGDTFKVKTACVSRLTSTFLKPVVDNLFLDVYYFFVPSRILYDKFVNIFGENTESKWANTQEYQVPALNDVTIPSKTVGDYLGLPVGMNLRDISILPFRAFAKIYEDWFRDQNNIDPMHIQTGELAVSEKPNSNAWAPNNYMGQCPKVAKFHDYFTSALPSPQKGDPVEISVGGFAPVLTRRQRIGSAGATDPDVGLTWANYQGVSSGLANKYIVTGPTGYAQVLPLDTGASNPIIHPDNLYADLSQAQAVSVNDLRFAFQYQKMLERDARGGTRYVEYIYSHFGVQAGDYRLQRSEFLGGRRSPLTITQVTQTTGADSDSSPLAQVGAYSLSNSRSRFTKSFVEHGYVVGVYCIRQHHTYQQGVERAWNRLKRTDFYDPVFANIGEQPIYKSELYGSRTDDDNPVFGYGEAWADLRYRPNRVTGQMRSGVTDSLDIWHFADNYSNAPTLSQSFIEETPQYVDRAITVESSAQDQFLLDFWISNIAYRALPTYSVPSLIDHN